MEAFDFSLIDWSRGQFALTAMVHWLFVPLTLGITFLIAIMETIYVKTGDLLWKKITKFWMTLFGINFAIGVATGIILEFEFGTNWSNYSWFVGDIFGAPLAIEGIMAFFLESTFIAVMFFGWNKVSKKFHLLSTWLVAIGSNLSALWILVANGWMQSPVGMRFNPYTARNEMIDFWEVLLSPVAVHKFLHTISSGYVVASLFVVGVSAWYLLKKREELLAKRSIVVASVFGLVSAVFLALTGDGSAYEVAQKQPMKLAAMEGLYDGQSNAGFIIVGALNPNKTRTEIDSASGRRIEVVNPDEDAFLFKLEVPGLLSFLSYRSTDAFVPGVNDLVEGNKAEQILSAKEKMARGRVAQKALKDFLAAKDAGNESEVKRLAAKFNDQKFQEENYSYFGYSYFASPNEIIPPIPLTFYSFHIMVFLGGYFIVFFMLSLFLVMKNRLTNKWLLRVAIWSIPLGYIASQAGWIVAEVGRQPWVIQDIMPTIAAVSQIDTSSVILTFFLFAVTFTALIAAELRIMLRAIKKGPKPLPEDTETPKN